jgi:N-acetylglucosamine kinase-like BadF-type ATPase
MASERGLVLGIDGGATSTRAVLTDRHGAVLGRGQAGPGNPKSAGFDSALEEVRRAIEAAFTAAKTEMATADAICLALAGAGRPEDRPPIEEWVTRQKVATKVGVVPDAVAVLAAGRPNVVGISLIAGTGSMAYGRDENGSEARAGGWGSLFGDEGSGYALAVAGLRAAVRAFDGRGPATTLLPAFLDRLKLTSAGGLVTTLYAPAWDKRKIAGLATVVTTCAETGDDIALGLLLEAAKELTAAALAVSQRLAWKSRPIVALTGGLVANSASFRAMLDQALSATQQFAQTILVTEPSLGAAAIARRIADGEEW